MIFRLRNMLFILNNMRTVNILLTFVIFSLSIAGCSKEKVAGEIYEMNSFVLDNNANAQEQQVVEAEGDWYAECSDDWFEISPNSGTSGQCMVTVRAKSDNPSVKERGGRITFVSGENIYSAYVYQRGRHGVEISENEYEADGFSGTFTISVGTNVKFNAASNADWLSVKEIRHGSVSELLNDGRTYSEYVTSEIVCELLSNESEERICDLTLTFDDQEQTVKVIQNPLPVPDWDRQFFRRTLGLRFTATWCGYCPNMASAYESACDMYPNRIIPLSCHPLTSEGGLAWDGTKELQDFYQVEAYPSTILNGYANVPNMSVKFLASGIVDIAKEAREYYPSKTSLMVSASKSSDNITANIRVAMKEKGEYKLCVYVVEDNIIYKQQGADQNYVHKYIVRGNLTDVFGEIIKSENDNEYCDVEISGKLPAKVKDLNNCYLVVYTTCVSDLISKDVDIADYKDYGFVVDNVVKCYIGERVDFKYED